MSPVVARSAPPSSSADLIKDDKNIDYDGVGGAYEFVDAGEPSEASIMILEFDGSGTIQVADVIFGKI